jgi:hypothetical protein
MEVALGTFSVFVALRELMVIDINVDKRSLLTFKA